MAKTVEIFRNPDAQAEMQRAQQQQMLAQAMMQSGQAPEDMFSQWNRMPIVPKYTAAHGLTQLGSALAGAYINKQATKDVQKAERDELATREKMRNEAMARMMQQQTAGSTYGGDPAAAGYGSGAQQKSYGQVLADAMAASEAGVPKEVVDAYIKANEGYTLGDTRYLANQAVATNEKPLDELSKLKDDLDNGRIGLNDYMARRELLTTRAPGVNVNVNTEKSLYGDLASKQAAQYSELYAAAQAAPEAIARTGRIRELLKTQPYTGTAANYKLALGKTARAAGFDFAEDDAANTEALAAEMARATLDNIKSSGLAGSQGLTEGERKFLAQAVAGEITLEPRTIGRLADLNERTARLTLNRWNQTASRLDPEQLQTLGMAPISQPDTPAGGPPRGKLVPNGDGTFTYTP